MSITLKTCSSHSPTHGYWVNSFFGKVRAWNQSSEAISLDHPPAILPLICDNHDIPTRYRELILPLNKGRNKQSTHTPRNEPELEHLSYAEVRYSCQDADLRLIVVHGLVLLAAQLEPLKSRNGSIQSFWCFCCGEDCRRNQHWFSYCVKPLAIRNFLNRYCIISSDHCKLNKMV